MIIMQNSIYWFLDAICRVYMICITTRYGIQNADLIILHRDHKFVSNPRCEHEFYIIFTSINRFR